MQAKDLMKKGYLSIDKSESVSKLIGFVTRTNHKTVLVFDGKKYIGVSDKNLLVRSKANFSEMKISKIAKRVPVLTGKEDIKEVARLLFTANVHMLPVIKKGIVVGIIGRKDVMNQLKDVKKKISDVMTLNPILVHENDRTGKAVEIMRENKVSRIPIVNKKGELIDITSLTDIFSQFLAMHQGKSETRGRGTLTQKGPRTIRAYKDRVDLTAYPIKNLTSPITITASPDDTVKDVINLMNKYDLSSIVVVEDKKPVGIVTVRDLLKLFLKEQVTY